MTINLPLARDKTYVDGVTSVDAEQLNNDQDMVIIRAHGEISENIAFIDAIQGGVWTQSEPGLLSPSGTTGVKKFLKYPIGTTVVNVDVEINQNSASTLTAHILRHDVDSSVGGGVSQQSSTSDTSTGDKTISLTTDFAIEAGYLYSVFVESAAISNIVYSANVSYHKDA